MRGNVNNVIFLQKITEREKDIAATLNNELQILMNIQQRTDISPESPAFNLKITSGEAFTNEPFTVTVSYQNTNGDSDSYFFPVLLIPKITGDSFESGQLSALNEPVTVDGKAGFVDFDYIFGRSAGSQDVINKFTLTQDGTVRNYLEEYSPS